MAPIRVLIADDHRLYRRAVRALLAGAKDMEAVAEADTADAAVAAVTACLPDVVLVDLRIPGGGLAATHRITEVAPQVGVLVVSVHKDERLLLAALGAGARGYVLKGAHRDELCRAIRGVHRGDTVLGPAPARRMAELAARGMAPVEPFPDLSGREREVLDGMARGLDNAAIAARLTLSPKTVRNVVSAVMRKLDARTRTEAVAKARDAGLGAS